MESVITRNTPLSNYNRSKLGQMGKSINVRLLRNIDT